MYRGACRYSLLCKTEELKTKGQKLLDHKLYDTSLIKTAKIELIRIEDWEFKNLNLSQKVYDSDTTELYDVSEGIAMSELQEDNLYGSDSTEIYGQAAEIIGTIKIINKNNEAPKTKKWIQEETQPSIK